MIEKVQSFISKRNSGEITLLAFVCGVFLLAAGIAVGTLIGMLYS